MTKFTAQEIKNEFSPLVQEIRGDLKISAQGFSAIENIGVNSAVYVLKDRQLESILKSQATLVLASAKLKDLVQNIPTHQCWVFSPNAELLMALSKSRFFMATPYRGSLRGVHASAHIDPSAQIGDQCTLGPGVVIGPRVQIGDGTFIGANSILEADVKVGKNCTLHPLVYVGHSCEIGDRCEIKPNSTIGSEGYGYAHDEKGQHYRIPHSGRVVLEEDVHVGANTAIDRGSLGDTRIGRGTKIDNQCHLAHNTVVGKQGLITAQFGAAGSCTIGDHFIAGGKTSLGGHLKVGNQVQLAGLTALTGDLLESGQYGGYPVQPLKDFLKTKAALLHLPELRKQVQKLLKGTATD